MAGLLQADERAFAADLFNIGLTLHHALPPSGYAKSHLV